MLEGNPAIEGQKMLVAEAQLEARTVTGGGFIGQLGDAILIVFALRLAYRSGLTAVATTAW